jgi:hypothetical protein
LLNKQEELTTSLEELDRKYKTGQITRTELKSSVQELIDKYGLEGQAIEGLIKKYDRLDEAAKKIKK